MTQPNDEKLMIEDVNDETQTVAEALGAAIGQWSRLVERDGYCEDNHWMSDVDDWIEHLEENYLPSGSGYDSGTTLDREASGHDVLVFGSGYHVMDEFGGYVGWWNLEVTACPSFEIPFTVEVENLSLPEGWDPEEAAERVERAIDTEGDETYGPEDLWDPVHDDDRIATEFTDALSREIPANLRQRQAVPDDPDIPREVNQRVAEIVAAYDLHVSRFMEDLSRRLRVAGLWCTGVTHHDSGVMWRFCVATEADGEDEAHVYFKLYPHYRYSSGPRGYGVGWVLEAHVDGQPTYGHSTEGTEIEDVVGIQDEFEHVTTGKFHRATMLGWLLDDLGVEPDKIKEVVDNVR